MNNQTNSYDENVIMNFKELAPRTENTDVKKRFPVTNFSYETREARLRWYGHFMKDNNRNNGP